MFKFMNYRYHEGNYDQLGYVSINPSCILYAAAEHALNVELVRIVLNNSVGNSFLMTPDDFSLLERECFTQHVFITNATQF